MTRGARPLRIAYVADTMIDVRSVEGLAARARVTLVVRAGLGDAVANNWPPREPVELVRLPGGRLRFAARAAAWLVRNRRRIDVAFALDNLVAAAAANAARCLGGPPVVLQVFRPTLDYIACQRGLRSPVRHAGRAALARALVAVNERAAAGIGAISQYCARQCARHNARVWVIPGYGVDTAVFAPRLDRREAKARLGFDPDRPVVLLRSRLAPEKDPATFFEAVRILRAQGRDLVAASMGGEHAAMTELARRHGVELVARAPSAFDEIPVWYMAADVDVQSSWAEGLGISPLEALACGTPVVVSAVGGLPEVVDGGRVGALVPPGDAAALAAAIAGVLDDPAAQARARTEGRRWIEERYRHDVVFDRWIALAREVARPPLRPSPRRRVLFVDHETRLSGAERNLLDLIVALGADVDAHVAVPGEGSLAAALRAAGATVHVVPMSEALLRTSRWDLAAHPTTAVRRAGAAALAGLRLTRLVRSLRPDLVVSNSQKAHLLTVPAARAGRVPHIWHVQDILQEGWLRRAFNVAAGLWATRVVALSHAVAASFDGSPVRRRVRVVHPWVRTTAVGEDDRRAWRRRLGAGEGEHLVGIVGQLARWKGQDVFLAAARRVARQRPDVRFAVVGTCLFPANEAAYAAELHRLAAADGLAGRVTFTGAVEPVDPVMAALDVLVHASRLPEPFGRVLVEAMAQGTPVISTLIGAGPEVVPAGAGLLVPPDDPDALAEAILALLATGKPNHRARAAASRFSAPAVRAGFLAVCDEVAP